jgi:ribose transport system permease protein/putative xylitol transport system permease protein
MAAKVLTAEAAKNAKIALIENGIIIMRLAQEYRLIIIGLAIIVAVSLDRLSVYMHSRRQ